MTTVEAPSRHDTPRVGAGPWLSHAAPRHGSEPSTPRTLRSGETTDPICPSCRRPLPGGSDAFRERAGAHGLTRRETQVMELIGQGRSNKDIVATLGLSPNTVKSYIRTAYRRLDLQSRSQAVLWVNGVGLEPGESSEG